MKRTRWILSGAIALFFLLGGWLWWVAPRSIDMATYAPANSLIYLESNRPLAVVDAIAETDAWKGYEAISVGPQLSKVSAIQALIRFTGIGPIGSVILSRSQLAVIVTELGTSEEGETLNVKPEGALIIQTHTAEYRIRPPVEEALQKLAERTYRKPTFRKVVIDGVEYLEWTSPQDARQIVAAVVGSLVFIGNSERVIQSCVAVSRGGPSLRDDSELHFARRLVNAEHALTFGYVPRAHSAQLLAFGLPLIIGRAPGDPEFQRLATAGAAKIFGGVAWSSTAYKTGIEDRYSISVQQPLIDRLRSRFSTKKSNLAGQPPLPSDLHSVTYYRLDNPAETWQTLKTSVSAQVDALSAIVFTSLLKSALASYGIDDPEAFLKSVSNSIVTLRFDNNGERSLLIAEMQDQTSLRKFFASRTTIGMKTERIGQGEILEAPNNETAVGFLNNLVVVGTPAEVRTYVESGQRMTDDNFRRITFFEPSPNGNIVTYTDDAERVRDFVDAITTAQGTSPARVSDVEQLLRRLPFAATETTMSKEGFERVTRSPLGQFSTLLPLVVPQKPQTGPEIQSR